MGKKAGRYSSSPQTPRKSRTGLTVGLMLAFLLILAAAVVFLLRKAVPSGSEAALSAGSAVSAEPAPQDTPEPETAPADTTVVTADGDSSSLTCKASYTVDPGTGDAGGIVATAGDKQLTNGMLQILYLSQVNAYRAAGAEIAPDFSRPLDCQSCPLEAGLSWQHYFLKKAILSWQAQQAALVRASQPQLITEEEFKPNVPNENIHALYISPDLPLNDFLYQDLPCYTPNETHQAYLDSMEQTLDTLAAGAGFAGLADMAQQLGVSADDFLQAALDYNTAYMYFTEASYDLTPADEEIDSYISAHPAALSGSGETVDIRHILLIPEGAEVASDGTVTATEAQWAQAQQQADEILAKWSAAPLRQKKDAAFSQLATTYSREDASRANGGCYYGLQPGQLIEPLDEWCFSDERQPGDHTVLRSDRGVHIVYFSAREKSADARNALVTQMERELWSQWLEQVPLTPDYNAAALWADTTLAAVTLEDSLYPDIAHERFPEAITYLQQDYNYCRFGSSGYIGSNGCGITTFAMLATYMTDSLKTPAMMARQFEDRYYDPEGHGTDGSIFQYAPAELGFYFERSASEMEDVIAALENGQVVISLQGSENGKGNFTSKGHYLLLMHYYPENDSIQVRDSNIFNYGEHSRTGSGHALDYFTSAYVSKYGFNYYIMQPKITSVPACCRCGSAETAPAVILTHDYTCEKCVTALARRTGFLSLLEELSHSK